MRLWRDNILQYEWCKMNKLLSFLFFYLFFCKDARGYIFLTQLTLDLIVRQYNKTRNWSAEASFLSETQRLKFGNAHSPLVWATRLKKNKKREKKGQVDKRTLFRSFNSRASHAAIRSASPGNHFPGWHDFAYWRGSPKLRRRVSYRKVRAALALFGARPLMLSGTLFFKPIILLCFGSFLRAFYNWGARRHHRSSFQKTEWERTRPPQFARDFPVGLVFLCIFLFTRFVVTRVVFTV